MKNYECVERHTEKQFSRKCYFKFWPNKNVRLEEQNVRIPIRISVLWTYTYVKVLANKYRNFHHVLLFLLLGDLQAATIHTVVGEMYKDQNVKCIIKHQKKNNPIQRECGEEKRGSFLCLYQFVDYYQHSTLTERQIKSVFMKRKKKDWRSATHKAVHKKARVKGDGETVK